MCQIIACFDRCRGLLLRWEQLRVGYFFGGDGESVLRIAAGGLCAGGGMAHAAPQAAQVACLARLACAPGQGDIIMMRVTGYEQPFIALVGFMPSGRMERMTLLASGITAI